MSGFFSTLVYIIGNVTAPEYELLICLYGKTLVKAQLYYTCNLKTYHC